MSPSIVVLDTRGVTDKAGFLTAAARDLQFPEYFGHNWDAFEECVRDFAAARGRTLVVWTGAAGLPDDVRKTATDIFDSGMGDSTDVLVVDGIDTGDPQPDFAFAVERIAIPTGSLAAAQKFWETVGFAVAGTLCQAEAMIIRLAEVDMYHPSVGPEIAVADLMGLVERLNGGGYDFTENAYGIDVTDPHGTLITFVTY